ncbi:MAG: FAD-linked oxidase C-terminal domain-containing protein [Candidatus Korarchaeota archaeon]|nr:FAD-binding protein [Thermoproteota archaeon]MCR8462987.1 FAD-binding protein [Thermoproteota archaeon]MCR8470677.1 FAD-binding protein [Thermoproteota archaeon]MCR8472317.1 FAD-binding protein [Thermoproteota archaeon]MCR8473414.1 FAD-binding protein [Thermoproteota archaeon]
MDNIIKFLSDVFGSSNILTEKEILEYYAYDAQPIKGEIPLAVVFPQNADQIREYLIYASKHKIPTYVRGGGTSLSGGAIPLIENAVVISMYRMNRIIDVVPQDLQARVEAGIAIDELNINLNKFDLIFPIDPGSSAAATIGGAIAGNAGGIKAVKYGCMRDGWVLSLEVVLPRGSIIETGTRTFKAAAGYNLTGLFIGSEGTLGVITKATLKLVAKPKRAVVIRAYFSHEREAAEFVVKLLKTGLDPTAIEFLDRDTLEAVKRYSGLEYKGNAMLLIELTGNVKEDIEKRLDMILDMLRNEGAIDITWSKTEEEYQKIWMARKAAAPSLSNIKPKYLVLDPTVPISKLPELVDICKRVAAKYDLIIATFGHAGDGNLHPNILYDPLNKDEFEKVLKAAKEISIETIKLGGTVSGEHGIGLEKVDVFKVEAGKEKLDLMWEMKKLFDPNGILNPGKLFPREYWEDFWRV